MKELARNATPEIVDDELELIRRILADHRDRLGTPELRHGLMVELPDAWPENLGSAADWGYVTTSQAGAGPLPYPAPGRARSPRL